jgi:hypothetical protein
LEYTNDVHTFKNKDRNLMAKVTGYRHYVRTAKWVERCIRSAKTPAQIETARRLLENYEINVNLKMVNTLPERFQLLCNTIVIGLRNFLKEKYYGS